MPIFAIYFTFADINQNQPSTLETFHNRLAALPKVPLVRVCSVMNAMLRSDTEPLNTAAHDGLVRAFFPAHLSARFLQKTQGQPVRFVFHRQQVLFVAKEALSHSSDDEDMPMESTALGEVFLMANDHMHAEFSESARDDEDQFVRMAVHVGPVQEAAEDRV